MMQWERIGQIFNPDQHVLSDECIAYAKSPQAVDMGDYVRVYFTSQKKDTSGKWVSCPQYVDYTSDFSKILGVCQKPLLGRGELGQFDEHGIFPMNVILHQNRILGYTSGWSRRKSVSVDMAIGQVESFDGGKTFLRTGAGGPVMSANAKEPFMIADGFVRFYQGQFHMWYIFGTAWKNFETSTEPERIYKIAHATSTDGVNWIRNSQPVIPDTLNDECQALPSVLEMNGRYHMVFCYRAVTGFRTDKNKSYRLGYAFSDNLTDWIRDDKLLNLERASSGWDNEMMCYPNLFVSKGNVYLLYNGNDFGKHGFGLARLLEM